MQIEKITKTVTWDATLRTLSNTPSFLQSSAWADILRAEGKVVERVFIKDEAEVIAAALLVMNTVTGGVRYAFCPAGPIIKPGADEKDVYAALLDFAQKENCTFLRVEPRTKPQDGIQVSDVNPATTTVLDLTQSVEAIFESAHKKTRYSLRVAAEAKLTIRAEKNLSVLLELLKKTGSRDNFRLHPAEHYKAILASTSTLQLTAYHDDVAVATGVWFGFAGTLTYLFAASDHDYRDLAAPYALQEAAIRQGKDNGCTLYDFFGIAPNIGSEKNYSSDPKHHYAGITQFKIRFGGSVESRPGTFDLIISPLKYTVYQAVRFLRHLF